MKCPYCGNTKWFDRAGVSNLSKKKGWQKNYYSSFEVDDGQNVKCMNCGQSFKYEMPYAKNVEIEKEKKSEDDLLYGIEEENDPDRILRL